MNKPFLKWAGNKHKILSDILPHIGSPKRTCEPFGGSLAVSLNVDAGLYVLSDINRDLMNVYSNVLNLNNELFLPQCRELFVPSNNQRDVYLRLRENFNNETSTLQRSILFLYLNRHCFNGLTRYNKKGKFNVPFGKYDKPSFPLTEIEAFRTVFSQRDYKLYCSSFEDLRLYDELEANDVVYFDPPYIPLTKTANFTDYSSTGFTIKQHLQLLDLIKILVKRGIKVVVSNSDTEATREIYKNAEVHSVQVTRTISAKTSSRTKTNELIMVF